MSQIKGRVIDYNTDAPIVGVLVQGVGSLNAPFVSTTTGADGTYTLDSTYLDDVDSKVTFTKAGYTTASMRVPSANNTDVVLAKDGTLPAVFLTLKRNPTKTFLFIAIGAAVMYLLFKYRKQLNFNL